jgi:hypothetical protein
MLRNYTLIILAGCTKKQQLNSLLASHNLCGVVNFPTRITHSSAIDNFFIDKCRNEAYSIYPLSNGLSDHDAQILLLNNLKCLNSDNCVVLLNQNLSYI